MGVVDRGLEVDSVSPSPTFAQAFESLVDKIKSERGLALRQLAMELQKRGITRHASAPSLSRIAGGKYLPSEALARAACQIARLSSQETEQLVALLRDAYISHRSPIFGMGRSGPVICREVDNDDPDPEAGGGGGDGPTFRFSKLTGPLVSRLRRYRRPITIAFFVIALLA